MKRTLILLIFMIYATTAYADECSKVPTDGCTITNNITLQPGTYYLPSGILVTNSRITLDCNNAVLVGPGNYGSGISVIGFDNNYINHIFIKNCKIINYNTGISIYKSHHVFIEYNLINNTQYGVFAYNDTDVVVLDSKIEGRGKTISGYGVSLSKSPDGKVERSTISNYYTAIWLNISPLRETAIEEDNFIDNKYNIKTVYTGKLELDPNWYGSAKESDIKAKFDSDSFIYDPWLCAPYPSTDITSCRGSEIPEFGAIGAAIAIVLSSALIFLSRKNK